MKNNIDILMEYKNYVITSDRKVLKRKDNRYVECDENDIIANYLKNICKHPERYNFITYSEFEKSNNPSTKKSTEKDDR